MMRSATRSMLAPTLFFLIFSSTRGHRSVLRVLQFSKAGGTMLTRPWVGDGGTKPSFLYSGEVGG